MLRCVSMLFLVLIWGCSSAEPPTSGSSESGNAAPVNEVDPDFVDVRLALNWYPEAEHGGYIGAQSTGVFMDHGLMVDVIPGGPNAPQQVIHELAAGHIHFAVSDADNVVKARAAGIPVVAVMAPLQNSPRCIMVHQAAGFQKLEDLANIELAISDTRPFALWMKHKLPLTNVTMIPFNGQVGEFLTKPNFAQQAYTFSEPFVAKENGSDPQVLPLSEIGFNPYACLLITTESVIQKSPNMVRHVVESCVTGWDRYLQNPVPVNEFINEMNGDMSMAALEFGVEAMKPLCERDPQVPPCGMTLERWTTLVQQIEEIKDIPAGAVKPAECFTLQFLPGHAAK